jgi:hypothetical protein
MHFGGELEFIEAEAWAQLHSAFASTSTASLGAGVRRWGRAVGLVTPKADVAQINRVIGLGVERTLGADVLTEVVGFFASAGARRWLLEWSPDARSVGGEGLLIAHGGIRKSPTLILCAAMDSVTTDAAPSGPTVVEIGPADAATYVAVVAPALGVPAAVAPGIVSTLGSTDWHFYLVYDDDRQPIAGAAMFVQERGAWFGVCGTTEAARNRGAQTALLRRRAHDARRLGCARISAHTVPDLPDKPNPSYRNMRRLGMTVAYSRSKYLFEGSQPL